MEQELELSCNGFPVTATIHAFIEKGFFDNSSTKEWTCYRRNYFALACYFLLDPPLGPTDQIHAYVNGKKEAIVAFGMKLSAVIADGTGTPGKPIELVQHTPKRDSGPKSRIEIVKVSPALDHEHRHSASFSNRELGDYQTGLVPRGPYLPLQAEPDPVPAAASNSSSNYTTMPPPNSGNGGTPSGLQTRHVFDRIQFKQATANNGKRRASQQYFQLIVELFADVRQHGATEPRWVKVCLRTSEKIVVRGRSPSHYQGENGGRGGGGSGGGSRAGSAGPSFPYSGSGPPSIYGSLQSNGSRAAHHTGYGGHMAGASASYGTNYTYGASDHGACTSPPDLLGGVLPSGGSLEGDHAVMDQGRYHYYPSTIYEAAMGHSGLPGQRLTQLPLPKFEATPRRLTTDPSEHAVRHDYPNAMPGAQWAQQPLERYQATDSSRGYFPTFNHAATHGSHVAMPPIVPSVQEEEESHEFT